VNREAQTLGIWSLVLGILGIFCCVGVSGIVAIILGVRSNRLAQNGFATAGIVLGIIGIIELLVAVAEHPAQAQQHFGRLVAAFGLLDDPMAHKIQQAGFQVEMGFP
jgi:Na+/melibiose symporter-like transporter